MSSLLAALALLSSTAQPARWPLHRFVKWRPRWGVGTIRAAGLMARVEVRKCGDRRPISEGCQDWYPVAAVSAPGVRASTLLGEAGVAVYAGIGAMPGGRRPSLILVTDSGGSAGCAQIDVAVVRRRRYRWVRLATAADSGVVCDVDPPRLAWPRDRTGHHRPEFLLTSRLGGQFTSNAGSWRAPRILALEGDRTVDVSADPALAPLFRADMARARRACVDRVHEPEGPCAGYAYDAARLGRLPEAWRVIDAQVRRGCRVPARGGACFQGDVVTPAFRAELATTLAKAGLR